MKKISLVIPCYNEEDVLNNLFSELETIASGLPAYQFEFVFIDDGSKDGTLSLLMAFLARDKRVVIVELSRNFGKESALSAGLQQASGDAVIPLDSDLQDPPELIGQMIEKWEDGAEVVLARRVSRSTDSLAKRVTAGLFYKFHNSISSVKIPENVGDFRLMDRVVVDQINALPERLRFMKGIFAWVGFHAVTVDYARPVRSAGSSKFSGTRLWNFALEGITSFSSVPLKIWSYLGVITAILSLCYGVFIAIRTLVYGIDVPGYASLLVFILFFGSFNLIGIGILGEYIGRIYLETKARPLYVMRRCHRADPNTD